MNYNENDLAGMLQGFGLNIKTQLNTTRANINKAEISDDLKKTLLSEVDTIESAIANPDQGFNKIFQSINNLNQKLNDQHTG